MIRVIWTLNEAWLLAWFELLWDRTELDFAVAAGDAVAGSVQAKYFLGLHFRAMWNDLNHDPVPNA